MNETLYVNNETLGSECYVGTWEEWEDSLSPMPLRDWYIEYEVRVQEQAEDIGDDTPEIMTFEEWVQDCLDNGLSVATEDEIESYPRLEK